jgi:hypothetical protein
MTRDEIDESILENCFYQNFIHNTTHRQPSPEQYVIYDTERPLLPFYMLLALPARVVKIAPANILPLIANASPDDFAATCTYGYRRHGAIITLHTTSSLYDDSHSQARFSRRFCPL